MVPHVVARKAHQRLQEFSFATPKRLLQQYPPINGHRQPRAAGRISANTGSAQIWRGAGTDQGTTLPLLLMVPRSTKFAAS